MGEGGWEDSDPPRRAAIGWKESVAVDLPGGFRGNYSLTAGR